MHANTALLFNIAVYSETDKIIIAKNVSLNFLISPLIGGSAESIKASWEEKESHSHKYRTANGRYGVCGSADSLFSFLLLSSDLQRPGKDGRKWYFTHHRLAPSEHCLII